MPVDEPPVVPVVPALVAAAPVEVAPLVEVAAAEAEPVGPELLPVAVLLAAEVELVVEAEPLEQAATDMASQDQARAPPVARWSMGMKASAHGQAFTSTGSEKQRSRFWYPARVFDPLPLAASPETRASRYAEVERTLEALLEGEDDWVAAMATVASELHQAFDYYDWTGFYRAAAGEQLVIGPYQGGHGCLRIPFDRGVCGAAARTRKAQLVPDVSAFQGHIACSGTTRSELVVPVLAPGGRLIAVLDVDSDSPSAFGEADRAGLQRLCDGLGARFASDSIHPP